LFGSLPAVPPPDATGAARIALGQALFQDVRLSPDGASSCATCHDPAHGGAGAAPTSVGHAGQPLPRNAPSVRDAALQYALFWDARVRDVESVPFPIPDAELAQKLAEIREYSAMFAAAFPGPDAAVTAANAMVAVGAWERTLVTPGAFDAYLDGDPTALTPAAVRGLEVFVASGCATCHNGPLVGGAMIQKLGLVHPRATDDPGRAGITGNRADTAFFKVPSLRNVADTAPYFHDGSVPTLVEAIAAMGELQLGKDLPQDAIGDIATFLEALGGAVPPAPPAPP
jgi:cytochrome c peroxidase